MLGWVMVDVYAKLLKNVPTHRRAGTFLLIYITFYTHISDCPLIFIRIP